MTCPRRWTGDSPPTRRWKRSRRCWWPPGPRGQVPHQERGWQSQNQARRAELAVESDKFKEKLFKVSLKLKTSYCECPKKNILLIHCDLGLVDLVRAVLHVHHVPVGFCPGGCHHSQGPGEGQRDYAQPRKDCQGRQQLYSWCSAVVLRTHIFQALDFVRPNWHHHHPGRSSPLRVSQRSNFSRGRTSLSVT